MTNIIIILLNLFNILPVDIDKQLCTNNSTRCREYCTAMIQYADDSNADYNMCMNMIPSEIKYLRDMRDTYGK